MKWTPRKRLKKFLRTPDTETFLNFLHSYPTGDCLVKVIAPKLYVLIGQKKFPVCRRCPLSYDGSPTNRPFCGVLSSAKHYGPPEFKRYPVEMLTSLIRFEAMLEVLEEELK